jgi:regulator of sigma E protease
MDFIAALPAYAWTVLFYGASFIAALMIVVFIHELGHFLIGRWSGAGVEAFSIGFGRELFGWTDRHGTRWRVALWPLGGYVKFFGDQNAASQPDDAAAAAMTEAEFRKTLPGQPLPWRAAIIAAGPIANFILAALIFALLAVSLGKTVVLPRVGSVIEHSAAEEAGFQKGDMVRAIDGQTVVSFFDITPMVADRVGDRLPVEIERDGKLMTLYVVPREDVQRFQASVLRRGLIGLRSSDDPADRTHVRLGPVEAVEHGIGRVGDIIAGSVRGLFGLTTGRTNPDQISGALGIATMVGNVASRGILDFFNIVAVVSVSVGFLNLLPIPVLDGGHLMFMLIEAARRGRPLSDRALDLSFRLGLVVIAGLAVFALSNDIRNLVIYLAHGAG